MEVATHLEQVRYRCDLSSWSRSRRVVFIAAPREHMRTRAHMRTSARMRSHARAHARRHTRTHTSAHACRLTHMHTRTQLLATARTSIAPSICHWACGECHEARYAFA